MMRPRIAKSRIGPKDVAIALSALGEAARDPDRTDKIGEFIGTLTGSSADVLLGKIWDDPIGRALLEEKRDLGATLCDRDYLASLPEGSLGRSYFEWTARRDFTAEGIAEAIRRQVSRELVDPGTTMAARVVDMHDLWHVLNGWDSDILGEVHLLGYSYAQLGAYAWLILGLVANLPLVLSGRFDGIGCLVRAIRRGRSAVLLPAVDWEAMLPLPIDEVRRQLGVAEPVPYQRLTFDELREIGEKSALLRVLRAMGSEKRSH